MLARRKGALVSEKKQPLIELRRLAILEDEVAI